MSMETNTQLRAILNSLIRTCRDGQEGFLTAAENIGHDEVKSILNEYSLQRARFTGELQAAAHSLGDSNPENVSTITGTLHRGWMNLRTAIAGRDRDVILAECVQEEEDAVAQFHKALHLQLPADIRETLQRQSTAIENARDRLKSIRQPAA